MKRTKEEQKQWRIDHRNDILKQKKKYRENNGDKIKIYYREYRNKNKQVLNKKRRIKHLLEKYSLTLEDYNQLFNSQMGKCTICNNELKSPHVDHSHKTGKIRGLLCFNCNILLGHSNDDINILNNAIIYLKNFE